MECPACSGELVAVTIGKTEIDACKNGCGGIWFDQNEIFAFDEEHEVPAREIVEIARERSTKANHSKQRHCPRCDNEPLVRQYFDHEYEVEIDLCWSCGGLWLDPGELDAIQKQFKTYEDRAAAVDRHVAQVVSDTRAKLDKNTKQQIASLEEQTQNVFERMIYVLRKIFGFDPDPTDGI